MRRIDLCTLNTQDADIFKSLSANLASLKTLLEILSQSDNDDALKNSVMEDYNKIKSNQDSFWETIIKKYKIPYIIDNNIYVDNAANIVYILVED